MSQDKEKKPLGALNALRGTSAALMTLAVLCAIGVIALMNREPSEQPQTVSDVNQTAIAEGCELLQTLYYTRCEHSVTRRVAAPSELVGQTLAQVQPQYAEWQISEFGAKEVAMSCQLDMFCPDHMVLMSDGAGQLCIFQNKYGDGLALVSELQTELGMLPSDVQDSVRRGMGFHTLAELEQWLESAES